MRFSRFRRSSLLLKLHWLLALLLVLNGSTSPRLLAGAPQASGEPTASGVSAAHAQTHCHPADASAPSSTHTQGKCPCCPGGGDCQCAPMVALSLPFSDLSSFTPPALTMERRTPDVAAGPRPQPLRPPIG